MEEAKTLVYFPDAETLVGLHTDWPEEIRTALCLREDGLCEIVVFHDAESPSAVADVATLTGRDESTFVVVPETDGYPTRHVSFAEEQLLCKILAETGDLAELASDYLINYSYVQDSLVLRVDTREADTSAKVEADFADGHAQVAPLRPRSPSNEQEVPSMAPAIRWPDTRRRMPWLRRWRRSNLAVLISPWNGDFRLTVNDGAPEKSAAAVRAEVVSVEADGSRLRFGWAADAGWIAAPGDVLIIRRAMLPPAVAARWSQGDIRATVRLSKDSCTIIEEQRVSPRSSTARSASTIGLLAMAGAPLARIGRPFD